jgi:sec-independent protein translocase protein TatC
MSFLEHLDELRTRLIRAAIAIAITFVIGWAFADKLFQVLEVPVKEALRRSRAEQAVKVGATTEALDLAAVKPGTEIQYTFYAPVMLSGVEVPAGTTIDAKVEVGQDGGRVIVPARPWGVGQQLLPAGVPIALTDASGASYIGPDDRLVIETVQGGFNIYVKVAFYAAIFLSVPYLLVQIWGFVSPGLYPHERKYVWPFVILSSLCFALGVVFAYKIAFPAACDYLVGLSTQDFRPLINADDYFDLALFIMLGLGLVFQIPTVTLILARLGLVTPGGMISVWRYAVVVIFIAAAFLSPTADIPNMLVFAAPMLTLYAVSIGIAWFFHRRRRTEEEALEEAAQG